MARTGGDERTLLARVLLQRGGMTRTELENALEIQAGQHEIELYLERSFGSGLRAELERRHRLRLAEAA
jgi:hypothetical protein